MLAPTSNIKAVYVRCPALLTSTAKLPVVEDIHTGSKLPMLQCARLLSAISGFKCSKFR